MAKRQDLEHEEQCSLITWATLQSKTVPELNLLFAIPNGGNRNIVTAVKLKKEGVRPGVPDLNLPVPRGLFHGLFIEMKKPKGGAVSADQRAWLFSLRANGYRAEVCNGWIEAKDLILDYLK
jgi:VRR-NUC domain